MVVGPVVDVGAGLHKQSSGLFGLVLAPNEAAALRIWWFSTLFLLGFLTHFTTLLATLPFKPHTPRSYPSTHPTPPHPLSLTVSRCLATLLQNSRCLTDSGPCPLVDVRRRGERKRAFLDEIPSA